MAGFFEKESIQAPPGFNRWRVPPASVAIHLSLGSVYAWSVFNNPLTRVLGVSASAADDWTLPQVTWIFSVAIVSLGLSAAVAGKWLERVGPRTVGLVSAMCWCGGFVLGGIGILTHQLWLLYLGYGVIGGIGLGLGYVSPVSTLIRWFPDRRGMATGLAIMGFGGGAIIGTALKESLISHFQRAPVRLGSETEVKLKTVEGRRLADMPGGDVEVVVVFRAPQGKVATNSVQPSGSRGAFLGGIDALFKKRDGRDLTKLPGVYVVGSGSTGLAETFFSLAVIYFLVMVPAALSYRIPAPDWRPQGWSPPTSTTALVSAHSVSISEATRTPQFYLLWIMLCFNVTAGIGILAVAKTMMLDVFGSSLPSIVTDPFASAFVVALSVFNMLGRFVWASASDRLGRKPTYTLFFVSATLLYLSIPWIAGMGARYPSSTWLTAFCVVTMLIMTMYGGGFATIPAYLADLFGPRQVGGIHGRLLTAWSTAGVLGPIAITWFRERSLREAMDTLASRIEPAKFEQTFGAPLSELPALIKKKTVTLDGLLKLVPEAVHPGSTLYNNTMYTMAGLLVIALIANLLVRPVHPRHWMSDSK